MKIKNKVFTVGNLSKLGFLVMIVSILGCGGGSGGISKIIEDQVNNAKNAGVYQLADLFNTKDVEGIKSLVDSVDKKIDLSKEETLNLELVKVSADSENITFKVNSSPNFYNFDYGVAKETVGERSKNVLIAKNYPAEIKIKNSTGFTFESVTLELPEDKRETFSDFGEDNEKTISLDRPSTAEELPSFFKGITISAARSIASNDEADKADSSDEADEADEADESDESDEADKKPSPQAIVQNLASFKIIFAPIFQVKLTENLIAQDLKYSSTIGEYYFGANKVDFSNLKFGQDFKPVLYIENDASDKRNIKIQFEGENPFKFVLYSFDGKSTLAQSSNPESNDYEFDLDPGTGKLFSFSYYTAFASNFENLDEIDKKTTLTIDPDTGDAFDLDMSKLFEEYSVFDIIDDKK